MTATRKQLAIVGNGMAASRLIDDLIERGAQRRYDITVYGEEAGGSYNRILLSRVLGGADADAIVTKPEEWYAKAGVRHVGGRRITRIDPAARALHADGVTHPYDVAILATGSVPFIPKIEGTTTPAGHPKRGCFAYRTMDDCVRIRECAGAGDNAVVLGGGLLGLEAAKALADLGLHVTVVHLLDTLMNQQVDAAGSAMLRRQIERCGIFVRTGRTIARVPGEERVEGVVLDDGTHLPADLVVFACGVRPRVDLAKASGIPTRGGVLVNDVLATEVPGVYAVGECVEHRGKVYGIVAPLWEQTAVLADVLSGRNPQARYVGSKLYARLKVAGVEVASMGLVEPELPTDEVIQVVEERRDAYRKLIVRDDRLLGAVLVGDTDAAATLVRYFERADPLPANRLSLLCPPAEGKCDPAEQLVCKCNRVSKAAIDSAIDGGAGSLEALAQCTKAGTGCGSCRGELVRLLGRRGQPA